jgi:large subunit ribosomal protein L23
MPRKTPRSAKRIARASPPKPFIPRPRTADKRAQQNIEPTVEKKSYSQRVFERVQEGLNSNKPHFQVGGKEVFFPHAKVILLRPSAKHTPYQAKFVVPRNFNKLDLRDYLYHLYGLRALNVTTQLLWARWTREGPGKPRYRSPQIKKMTIEMADPFVWPEPTPRKDQDEKYNIAIERELRKYGEDAFRVGSDKLRPPRAFGGIVGPYVTAPSPFLPKKVSRRMANKKKTAEANEHRQKDVELVKKYLGLS